MTKNTVDTFSERLIAKLASTIEANPSLKDGGGFTYSLHNGSALISLTLKDNTGAKQVSVPTGIGHIKITEAEEQGIIEIVTGVCRTYGFIPTLRNKKINEDPTTIEYIQQILDNKIAKITSENKEFSDSTSITRGIFSAIRLLNPERQNLSIKVYLRPTSDITRAELQYIHAPHAIEFTTGTRDVATADKTLQQTKELLLNMGFQEREITGKANPEKTIPKQWLDIASMRVRKSASKYYDIILVSGTPLNRRPTITLSTGIEDLEGAERAQRALRTEFIAPHLSRMTLWSFH